jgi:hypothetical protein
MGEGGRALRSPSLPCCCDPAFPPMPRPSGWTDKDQRQYEHIREGELARGRSPRKAAEIAARTVNKQRRRRGGRTRSRCRCRAETAASPFERPQHLSNRRTNSRRPQTSRTGAPTLEGRRPLEPAHQLSKAADLSNGRTNSRKAANLSSGEGPRECAKTHAHMCRDARSMTSSGMSASRSHLDAGLHSFGSAPRRLFSRIIVRTGCSGSAGVFHPPSNHVPPFGS